MTKRFQHFGETRFQMRDGAFPVGDTVLNGNTRITTGMRIEAEPAPRVAPGDLGVLWTGNAGDGSGRVPTQTDIDNVVRNVEDLVGVLTPAQRSKIQEKLTRYSGRSAGTTSAVGITSNDAARSAVAQVAAGIAQVDAISDANRSFWDKKLEENQRLAYGR